MKIVNAPEENVFWCSDGKVFRNLQELASALETMDDETFSHHANNERNDFSNWIADVFSEKKLAFQIKNMKSPALVAKRLKERLRN